MFQSNRFLVRLTILPATHKIWGTPELKNGRPKLIGVEPVALELSSTTPQQEWPLLLYLHHFPKNRQEDFNKLIEIKNCRFKKSNLAQKVAQAQSIAICLNADNAFASEDKRQEKIGEPVDKLSKAIRKAEFA
jgi:hypothetical protein